MAATPSGKATATKVKGEGYYRPAVRTPVRTDGLLGGDHLHLLSWQRFETRSAAVKEAQRLLNLRADGA